MCVMSMVYDHFNQQFPTEYPFRPMFPSTVPTPTMDELRKLLADFQEAVAAARVLDKILKQPDCEDPEKAKLLDRIAQLEAEPAWTERE